MAFPGPMTPPGRIVGFAPMYWCAGTCPGKLPCAASSAITSGRSAGALARANLPQVIGSGWLTVVAFPASQAVAGFAAGHAAPLPAGGPAGTYLPWLRVLLKTAAPVHGAFGTGRLIRTALFSVLITSKGQVLVGAVTPDVLYAAAATLK
jgi:hypothetical protein